MDYHQFLEQLPSLYENWGTDYIHPKSNRFYEAGKYLSGMTTTNVMQLLNFAVKCMEPDEIYCEIGSYQGATLIGALLDAPEQMAYAVDNFSQFDPDGKNQKALEENLEKFGLESQVCFCCQDFEQFFVDLKEVETENKIGVYLYDGAHDYRSQLMGLFLVRPFLASQAILIVDDANEKEVQQANLDFITLNPECKLLLEFLTPGNGYPTFWNGIQVLSWDSNSEG
jgi:predicted O-methyltransferase YrrM